MKKRKYHCNTFNLLEPKEKSIKVKWRIIRIFSQIAKNLKEAEIIQIFSRIINYLSNETAERKDIYIKFIKTFFNYCPASFCYMIDKVIVPFLTKEIESKNQEIIQLYLDAFTNYVRTFDNVLLKENISVIKNKDIIIQIVVIYVTNDDLIGEISILLNKKKIYYLSNTLYDLFKCVKTVNEKIEIFNIFIINNKIKFK